MRQRRMNKLIRNGRILFVFVGLLTLLSLGACTMVKPYQMVYLNDEEMELSPRKVQSFETNFQTYREGASGGEGGKVGGGCGCN